MQIVARVLDLPGPASTACSTGCWHSARRLGIPHTLADIGVTLRNPDVIGREAAIDPSAGGNPHPIDAATSSACSARPSRATCRSRADELAHAAHPRHRRQPRRDTRQAGRGRRHLRAKATRRAAGLNPGLHCDIVRPADAAAHLPAGVALATTTASAITGSALNVYDGGPHIAAPGRAGARGVRPPACRASAAAGACRWR